MYIKIQNVPLSQVLLADIGKSAAFAEPSSDIGSFFKTF